MGKSLMYSLETKVRGKFSIKFNVNNGDNNSNTLIICVLVFQVDFFENALGKASAKTSSKVVVDVVVSDHRQNLTTWSVSCYVVKGISFYEASLFWVFWNFVLKYFHYCEMCQWQKNHLKCLCWFLNSYKITFSALLKVQQLFFFFCLLHAKQLRSGSYIIVFCLFIPTVNSAIILRER